MGRTGRAGKEGLALSLFEKREQYKLDAITDFHGKKLLCKPIEDLKDIHDVSILPLMTTISISGGRKQKVRPGDIVGALTGEADIAGNNIGKIDIFDSWSYVAVKRIIADTALQRLSIGKIKGRTFKVRFI